jgi:hypothetical protein
VDFLRAHKLLIDPVDNALLDIIVALYS